MSGSSVESTTSKPERWNRLSDKGMTRQRDSWQHLNSSDEWTKDFGDPCFAILFHAGASRSAKDRAFFFSGQKSQRVFCPFFFAKKTAEQLFTGEGQCRLEKSCQAVETSGRPSGFFRANRPGNTRFWFPAIQRNRFLRYTRLSKRFPCIPHPAPSMTSVAQLRLSLRPPLPLTALFPRRGKTISTN